MKHSQRLTVAATAAALLAIPALSACSGGQSDAVAEDCTPKYGEFDTITEGKLAFNIYDGMPYFGSTGDGQEGIDADFLNEFAEASCLEPEWTVSPSAAVIQSVASGRADIAGGGWYATEERGEIVDQSTPIYVELPTIFAAEETADVESLRGKTVGTVTGYLWVDELKSIADVKEYQSSDATLSDLAEGRIDYAVLGSIDAPYLLEVNSKFSELTSALMEPNDIVRSSSEPQLPNYPHTKGNAALTEALNAAIQDAHESGRFAEIVESYGLDPAIVDVSKYE